MLSQTSIVTVNATPPPPLSPPRQPSSSHQPTSDDADTDGGRNNDDDNIDAPIPAMMQHWIEQNWKDGSERTIVGCWTRG